MVKKCLSIFLLVLAYVVMMGHTIIPHEHHHHYEDPVDTHHHHDEHTGAEDHSHSHSHPVHPELIIVSANRIIISEVVNVFLPLLAIHLACLLDINPDFSLIDSYATTHHHVIFKKIYFSFSGLRAPPYRANC